MELKVKIHNVYNMFKSKLLIMPLLLEHVEDKLALHGILDKLILADVAVSLFIHSIPVNLYNMKKLKYIINHINLMSETQTVTRSSSSSIPASLKYAINDDQETNFRSET